MKLLYIPLMFLFLFFNSYLLFSEGKELDNLKLKEVENFLSDKTEFEQLVYLDKLIAQHKSYIELYKMKAKVELKTNDYIGVIKTVLKVLKASNEDIELLNLLAISYFNLNDTKRASLYFNKVLERSPKDGVAIFYLSLIDPVVRSSEPIIHEEKEAVDIAALLAIFNRLDNSSDIPFTYLLDRTEFNLDSESGYSYTQHHILLLNSAKAVERFKKFKYSYDSDSFTPDLLRAGHYRKDNIENFIKLENLDENFRIGGIYPEGYLSLNSPDLTVGSIIEYKIKYTIKPDKVRKIAEHFYFTTLNHTVKKELTLVKPGNLKLSIKPIGSEAIFTEQERGDDIIMSYTMFTPPLLNEGDKRTASSQPGAELIISAYEDISELQKSYTNLFSRVLSDSKDEFESELSLEETANRVYHKHQIDMIGSNEGSFEFNSIEGSLRYHFDRAIRSTTLFIDALNEAGIKAYPILTKNDNLTGLYSEPPHPYLFSHGLIYIAAQAGLEKGFLLDISTPYIDYKNLSPLQQGLEAAILKEKGTIENISTPVISPEMNIIEEKYKIELDAIGSADLEVGKRFAGAFSSMLRSETSDLTADELIKHFLNIESPLSKDFERERVKIEGYASPSGAINFDFKSEQSGFSEIFFDGRQTFKEDIKSTAPLFRFPHKSSTPYIVPFLFTYKKSSEYIFPEDYVIGEHNLQSFSRENRYLYFSFEPQKLAENHFIFNFEFSVKSREIDPADLFEVNIFVNSLIERFAIEVTMENRTSFDYNSFFEQLIAEYSDPTLYQAYIERLLEDEKFDKAEEIALKGEATFEDSNFFKTILALIYLEKGDYQKSEEIIQKLLVSEADNPKIYLFLITLYKESGDKERLLETVVDSYQKFPANDDIVREVVNFYQTAEEYDKAIAILKERLNSSTSENKGRYYSELGYIYSLQDNFTEAEQNFLKAIELNPDDAYALNNLAWLYCENGVKIDEAIAYAERACSIEESKDSFLDTLAEAYYLKGEHWKAFNAIKRALEINPESEYIQKQFDKIKKAFDEKQKGDNDGK